MAVGISCFSTQTGFMHALCAEIKAALPGLPTILSGVLALPWDLKLAGALYARYASMMLPKSKRAA